MLESVALATKRLPPGPCARPAGDVSPPLPAATNGPPPIGAPIAASNWRMLPVPASATSTESAWAAVPPSMAATSANAQAPGESR